MSEIFFCGLFWMSCLLLKHRATKGFLAHAQGDIKMRGIVTRVLNGERLFHLM